MALTKIGTEKIDGLDYEIQIDDAGSFRVEFEGVQLHAPTKKAIVDKLRTAVRSHKRVAVPATLLESYYRGNRDRESAKHITLTGIHGSSGNVLYREDGKKGRDASGQLSSYQTVCRRLTEDEITEFRDLERAKYEAEQALEKWKTKHKLHAKDAVQREAKKVAGVMDEGGED